MIHDAEAETKRLLREHRLQTMDDRWLAFFLFFLFLFFFISLVMFQPQSLEVQQEGE